MNIPAAFEEKGFQESSLSINIFRIQPPKIIREKPPEPKIKEKTTTEEVSTIDKPKISQNEPTFKITQMTAGFRIASNSIPKSPQISESLLNRPKISQKTNTANQSFIPTKNSYSIEKKDIEDKIKPVNINEPETSEELSDASPSIDREVSSQKWRRGQGLRFFSYSNSSSSTVPKNEEKGAFYYMMLNLANDIVERADKKVDIVFVLDTTGSMDDNIRGVRAYTELFFEQLKLNSIDTAIGLVTFSDIRIHRPEVFGVTQKIGKVRNKLFDIEFTGGSELAESGLDALVSALNEIKFRKNARKSFIFISDGTFHDADFDGQSQYSLDETIELLEQHNITVDVVGIDYLPVKQIAYATGGNWRIIPGTRDSENIQISGNKGYSKLGVLTISQNSLEDEIIVQIGKTNDSPDWILLTYKLLEPSGKKCLEGRIKKECKKLNTDIIKLFPDIKIEQFSGTPGTYTLIYKIENSNGKKSILRRMFELNPK